MYFEQNFFFFNFKITLDLTEKLWRSFLYTPSQSFRLLTDCCGTFVLSSYYEPQSTLSVLISCFRLLPLLSHDPAWHVRSLVYFALKQSLRHPWFSWPGQLGVRCSVGWPAAEVRLASLMGGLGFGEAHGGEVPFSSHAWPGRVPSVRVITVVLTTWASVGRLYHKATFFLPSVLCPLGGSHCLHLLKGEASGYSVSSLPEWSFTHIWVCNDTTEH